MYKNNKLVDYYEKNTSKDFDTKKNNLIKFYVMNILYLMTIISIQI